MEPREEAVSAKQCAPLVGTSVSALYKCARAGIVPCLRPGVRGRALRFLVSEVRKALESRMAWTPSRGAHCGD